MKRLFQSSKRVYHDCCFDSHPHRRMNGAGIMELCGGTVYLTPFRGYITVSGRYLEANEPTPGGSNHTFPKKSSRFEKREKKKEEEGSTPFSVPPPSTSTPMAAPRPTSGSQKGSRFVKRGGGGEGTPPAAAAPLPPRQTRDPATTDREVRQGRFTVRHASLHTGTTTTTAASTPSVTPTTDSTSTKPKSFSSFDPRKSHPASSHGGGERKTRPVKKVVERRHTSSSEQHREHAAPSTASHSAQKKKGPLRPSTRPSGSSPATPFVEALPPFPGKSDHSIINYLNMMRFHYRRKDRVAVGPMDPEREAAEGTKGEERKRHQRPSTPHEAPRGRRKKSVSKLYTPKDVKAAVSYYFRHLFPYWGVDKEGKMSCSSRLAFSVVETMVFFRLHHSIRDFDPFFRQFLKCEYFSLYDGASSVEERSPMRHDRDSVLVKDRFESFATLCKLSRTLVEFVSERRTKVPLPPSFSSPDTHHSVRSEEEEEKAVVIFLMDFGVVCESFLIQVLLVKIIREFNVLARYSLESMALGSETENGAQKDHSAKAQSTFLIENNRYVFTEFFSLFCLTIQKLTSQVAITTEKPFRPQWFTVLDPEKVLPHYEEVVRRVTQRETDIPQHIRNRATHSLEWVREVAEFDQDTPLNQNSGDSIHLDLFLQNFILFSNFEKELFLLSCFPKYKQDDTRRDSDTRHPTKSSGYQFIRKFNLFSTFSPLRCLLNRSVSLCFADSPVPPTEVQKAEFEAAVRQLMEVLCLSIPVHLPLLTHEISNLFNLLTRLLVIPEDGEGAGSGGEAPPLTTIEAIQTSTLLHLRQWGRHSFRLAIPFSPSQWTLYDVIYGVVEKMNRKVNYASFPDLASFYVALTRYLSVEGPTTEDAKSFPMGWSALLQNFVNNTCIQLHAFQTKLRQHTVFQTRKNGSYKYFGGLKSRRMIGGTARVLVYPPAKEIYLFRQNISKVQQYLLLVAPLMGSPSDRRKGRCVLLTTGFETHLSDYLLSPFAPEDSIHDADRLQPDHVAEFPLFVNFYLRQMPPRVCHRPLSLEDGFLTKVASHSLDLLQRTQRLLLPPTPLSASDALEQRKIEERILQGVGETIDWVVLFGVRFSFSSSGTERSTTRMLRKMLMESLSAALALYERWCPEIFPCEGSAEVRGERYWPLLLYVLLRCEVLLAYCPLLSNPPGSEETEVSTSVVKTAIATLVERCNATSQSTESFTNADKQSVLGYESVVDFYCLLHSTAVVSTNVAADERLTEVKRLLKDVVVRKLWGDSGNSLPEKEDSTKTTTTTTGVASFGKECMANHILLQYSRVLFPRESLDTSPYSHFYSVVSFLTTRGLRGGRRESLPVQSSGALSIVVLENVSDIVSFFLPSTESAAPDGASPLSEETCRVVWPACASFTEFSFTLHFILFMRRYRREKEIQTRYSDRENQSLNLLETPWCINSVTEWAEENIWRFLSLPPSAEATPQTVRVPLARQDQILLEDVLHVISLLLEKESLDGGEDRQEANGNVKAVRVILYHVRELLPTSVYSSPSDPPDWKTLTNRIQPHESGVVFVASLVSLMESLLVLLQSPACVGSRRRHRLYASVVGECYQTFFGNILSYIRTYRHYSRLAPDASKSVGSRDSLNAPLDPFFSPFVSQENGSPSSSASNPLGASPSSSSSSPLPGETKSLFPRVVSVLESTRQLLLVSGNKREREVEEGENWVQEKEEEFGEEETEDIGLEVVSTLLKKSIVTHSTMHHHHHLSTSHVPLNSQPEQILAMERKVFHLFVEAAEHMLVCFASPLATGVTGGKKLDGPVVRFQFRAIYSLVDYLELNVAKEIQFPSTTADAATVSAVGGTSGDSPPSTTEGVGEGPLPSSTALEKHFTLTNAQKNLVLLVLVTCLPASHLPGPSFLDHFIRPTFVSVSLHRLIATVLFTSRPHSAVQWSTAPSFYEKIPSPTLVPLANLFDRYSREEPLLERTVLSLPASSFTAPTPPLTGAEMLMLFSAYYFSSVVELPLYSPFRVGLLNYFCKSISFFRKSARVQHHHTRRFPLWRIVSFSEEHFFHFMLSDRQIDFLNDFNYGGLHFISFFSSVLSLFASLSSEVRMKLEVAYVEQHYTLERSKAAARYPWVEGGGPTGGGIQHNSISVQSCEEHTSPVVVVVEQHARNSLLYSECLQGWLHRCDQLLCRLVSPSSPLTDLLQEEVFVGSRRGRVAEALLHQLAGPARTFVQRIKEQQDVEMDFLLSSPELVAALESLFAEEKETTLVGAVEDQRSGSVTLDCGIIAEYLTLLEACQPQNVFLTVFDSFSDTPQGQQWLEYTTKELSADELPITKSTRMILSILNKVKLENNSYTADGTQCDASRRVQLKRLSQFLDFRAKGVPSLWSGAVVSSTEGAKAVNGASEVVREEDESEDRTLETFTQLLLYNETTLLRNKVLEVVFPTVVDHSYEALRKVPLATWRSQIVSILSAPDIVVLLDVLLRPSSLSPSSSDASVPLLNHHTPAMSHFYLEVLFDVLLETLSQLKGTEITTCTLLLIGVLHSFHRLNTTTNDNNRDNVDRRTEVKRIIEILAKVPIIMATDLERFSIEEVNVLLFYLHSPGWWRGEEGDGEGAVSKEEEHCTTPEFPTDLPSPFHSFISLSAVNSIKSELITRLRYGTEERGAEWDEEDADTFEEQFREKYREATSSLNLSSTPRLHTPILEKEWISLYPMVQECYQWRLSHLASSSSSREDSLSPVKHKRLAHRLLTILQYRCAELEKEKS